MEDSIDVGNVLYIIEDCPCLIVPLTGSVNRQVLYKSVSLRNKTLAASEILRGVTANVLVLPVRHLLDFDL